MLWRRGLTTRWVCLCCRYVHDDSETSEDQVELTVSDGVNAAEASLSIQVGRIYLSKIYQGSI